MFVRSSPVIITLDSDGSRDGPSPSPLLATGPLPVGGPGGDRDVDVVMALPLGPEEEGGSKVGGEAADGRLLASILGDLQVAPPRSGSPSSLDGRSGSGRGGAPLRLMPDLPPLLKQVSPIRSYGRNTPPPLRRSDAPSPRLARPANHKPSSPPGSAPQGAVVRSSSPEPGRGPTSPGRGEARASAEDTPPGGDRRSGVGRTLADDRETGGQVSGVDGPPPPASSVLIMAANIASLPAARCSEGALLEDTPPLQTARLKCGVSAALGPPAPQEADLSAEGRSDLLATSRESPPPVDSH